MADEPDGRARARGRRLAHRWVPVAGLEWERRVGYDPAAWRGDVMRARREAAGWTTAELAALTGYASGSIFAYERGTRPAPPDLVAILAALFGCSFRAFFAPRARGNEFASAHVTECSDVRTAIESARALSADAPEV